MKRHSNRQHASEPQVQHYIRQSSKLDESQCSEKTSPLTTPTSRQITVEEAFKTANREISFSRPKTASQITKSIVDAVIKNSIPPSIFDDYHFREAIFSLNPNFSCPSSKYFFSHLLPARALTIRDSIREKVSTSMSIGISLDLWKQNTKSFLGIILHVLNSNDDSLQINDFPVALHYFPEQHSAANITMVLQDARSQYIDACVAGRVTSVTTDNASNMKALRKSVPDLTWIGCALHNIALLTHDSSNKQDATISKCRKLADKFRNERAFSYAFAQRTSEMLSLDVEHRWNSTYVMLEKINKHRVDIAAVLSELNQEADGLLAEDWENVRDFLAVFQYAYDATLELSSSNSPSAFLVSILAFNLRHKLSSLVVTTPGAIELRARLLENFNKRLGHYLEPSSIFMQAAFLNPSFKHLFGPVLDIGTESVVLHAVDDLRKQRHVSQDIRAPDVSTNCTRSSYMLQVDWQPSPAQLLAPVEAQLAVYRSMVIPNTTSVLKFWHNNRDQLPDLFELASKLMTHQATSVVCERGFSLAGSLYTANRNRLSPSAIEDLFIIQNELTKSTRNHLSKVDVISSIKIVTSCEKEYCSVFLIIPYFARFN
jgi:hypothetical protein